MDKLQKIIEKDKKYFFNPYSPHDICFDRGEGSVLYDINGKRYLDFLSGIAVDALGHNSKIINRALLKQAKKLMVTSNYFYNDNRAELAKQLVRGTHLKKAFFVNSGAEANEFALKLARKYSNNKNYKRFKYVCALNSFHGRTFAAVSATGQEKYNLPFAPLPDWFIFVPYNDTDALKKALADKDVCGLLIEAMQGEGGVVPATQEFLLTAYKLTRKYDQIMIVDEVQTGAMRTGKFFAFEHYNIKPDIVTVAKGMGGGFPIGATIVTDKVADALKKGEHGTTFGGNHLACAVSLAVVKELRKPEFINAVNDKAEYLKNKLVTLNKYPFVKEVRGMGLMQGIFFDESVKAKDLVKILLDKGVVACTAGENTLRFIPPLIIKKEEIDEMFKILEEVLSDCAKG